MKIKLIVVGKTDESYLNEGINKYITRLKHYVDFEMLIIPDVKMGKKNEAAIQKEKEGQLILSKVKKSAILILLDEKGKGYTSEEFAQVLQKKMNSGMDIFFVIGGPFGFSDEIYQRANTKIALSQMTFSHQMVRVFFIEQLYRSFSILKGEKYHH